MIIGLDIDNVISDFDKVMFPLFLQEDKNKRNAGIVDKNAHYMAGMFDWSAQEVEDFLINTCEPYAPKLPLRKNAKKYIDLLIEKGHKIILISHRAPPTFSNGEQVTKEWLERKGVNYHKLVLSKLADKTQECFENKVDILFDDRVGQVKKMREKGVNCVVVITAFNKPFAVGEQCVSTWKKLYEYVCLMDK